MGLAAWWRGDSIAGLQATAPTPAVMASAGQAIEDFWGLVSGVGSINRTLAMSVPAFSQGVYLIANTCGGFDFLYRQPDGSTVPAPLLDAPTPGVAASIVWGQVFADLVLYPQAWLKITSRDAGGYPLTVARLDPETVSADADGRVFHEGRHIPDRDLIRLDSPVAPGALKTASRALLTALDLEDAARRYASQPMPTGYLYNKGGDPLDPEDIAELLAAWQTGRKTSSTAYLNEVTGYEVVGFDPASLQLVEARRQAAADIARCLNLPPSAVNAPTQDSLTYSTTESNARTLLVSTLTPYLAAVAGRLSLEDVTPPGYRVTYQAVDFLKGDRLTRYQAHAVALGGTGGPAWMSVSEVRAAEDLPPIDPGELPAAETAQQTGAPA